jgi:hypothetical protein
MTEASAPRGRLQLLLLALLFAAPLLLAMLFYFVPSLQPKTTTNYGTFVRPAQPLPELDWWDASAETVPKSRLQGRWTLVYPVAGDCDAVCEADLVNYRQARLLLNEKRTRVQRALLSSEASRLPALRERLGQAHPDLLWLAPAAADNPAHALFSGYNPRSVVLVDPLGNVMMVFPPQADLRKVLKDIKRLLRVSQIG